MKKYSCIKIKKSIDKVEKSCYTIQEKSCLGQLSLFLEGFGEAKPGSDKRREAPKSQQSASTRAIYAYMKIVLWTQICNFNMIIIFFKGEEQ